MSFEGLLFLMKFLFRNSIQAYDLSCPINDVDNLYVASNAVCRFSLQENLSIMNTIVDYIKALIIHRCTL